MIICISLVSIRPPSHIGVLWAHWYKLTVRFGRFCCFVA